MYYYAYHVPNVSCENLDDTSESEVLFPDCSPWGRGRVGSPVRPTSGEIRVILVQEAPFDNQRLGEDHDHEHELSRGRSARGL
jgi:hypothetical protein